MRNHRPTFGVLATLMLLTAAAGAQAFTPQRASSAESVERRLTRLEGEAKREMAEAEAARRTAERARRRSEASRRRAEELAREAQEVAQQNAAARIEAEKKAAAAVAQAQRDAAEARAEAARADEAQRQVTVATRRASEASAEAARTRREFRLALGLGAGGFVLLLGAGFLLRRRMRSEVATLKQARPEPVASCVLRSPAINLQLAGRQLPDAAGGVVLGRNPEAATAVINKPDVSRRHARFFHRDGRYWVEDLKSEGGTSVDGVIIRPGEPAPLATGTAVAFAAHGFEFHVLP